MRLTNEETRIVNAIRGIKKGRVMVHKGQDGQFNVEIHAQVQPLAAVQQSQAARPGRVDKLRG